MRELIKASIRTLALIVISPALLSYAIRAAIIGPDRALAGSTQALALLPGLTGQYLRRAFLMRTLAACDPSATVEFGTLFSRAGTKIGRNAYVGPRCHIGLADIGENVMLAAGVHVPSGGQTHGSASLDTPMRDQPGTLTMIHIGAGAWVGSAAVVMADVGADTIVGAGAVVTQPLPAAAIAAGVPARVLRMRADEKGA